MANNLNVTTVASDILRVALSTLIPAFGETQGTILANLLLAQGKFESSLNGKEFSSNVFKKYLNSFGYGYNGSTYKDYSNLPAYAYGALDVANWLIRRKGDFQNVKDCTQYATALSKNDYFEGGDIKNYAGGMQHFYAGVTVTKKNATALVAVVGAAAAIYYALK